MSITDSETQQPQRLYDWPFFIIFMALLCYMGGSSMLVHLRKYVATAGGGITTISWVFGIGMVGSIITRPFVGTSIDRFGCSRILRLATILGTLSILGFLLSANLWLICSLRVVFQLGQATFLATAAVTAARIAPKSRSAESLAMLGMGGLLGLMAGPMIGDWIFSTYSEADGRFTIFFLTAAALMLVSLAFASCLKVPEVKQAQSDRESFFHVVWRHKPGPIVIMAFCLAMVQTIPVMFIEGFVNARKLDGVTMFFLAYSPTAILLRIVLRRLPAYVGRRRTLITGMIAYPIGLFLLTRVHETTGLILPAIVMGFGHCFTYPFLVDLAAESMPPQHRGAATALILGVLDLGFLSGFIAIGKLTHRYGFDVSLRSAAAFALVGTAAYAWTQRGLFQPLRPIKNHE
ncbi:MAG TPA: MFS transporter [Phycisphaerae bacterium]|nr:MFS transporter [Phycisphaerae bacterium]